jgi:hypothetical protein
MQEVLLSQQTGFNENQSEQGKKMRQKKESQRQKGRDIDDQMLSDMLGDGLAYGLNKGDACSPHTPLISFGSHS